MAALSESELPHGGRGAALAWRLASDDALARAVARGNDAAFAALYDRYHAPLLRYCRSMLLGADDAQDAAQNALTAALRSLRSPDRATPLRLRPWLYRIAHNEALGVARRRPAVVELDDEATAVAAPDLRESRAALRELVDDLQTLPGRQRSALVLRELEGLSYDEVGAALSLSVDAARAAVFEARSALWAQRDGRDSACEDIQRRLSAGDGRTARSRDLRAHLTSCQLCDAFATQIRARRRSLRALFPVPGILAAGSGSGWALFGGATVATKCAALCATAVVVGGSVAALETSHMGPHKRPLSATAGATPSLPAPTSSRSAAPRAPLVVATRAAARTRKPARVATRRRVVREHARHTAPVTQVRVAHTTPQPAAVAPPEPPPAQTTEQASAVPEPTSTQPAAVAASTATTQQRLQASLAATQERLKASLAATQEHVKSTLAGVQATTSALLTGTQQTLTALRERLQAALNPSG